MRRYQRTTALWIALIGAIVLSAVVIPLWVTADSGQPAFTATLYSDVIRFEADGVASLRVTIYDLSESDLWNSGLVMGDFVDWDRANARGERLANGYYMYLAQGWDASEMLVLNKAGKVVLLPGDQVQLKAAPVAAWPVVDDRDDPIMSPMTQIIDDSLTVRETSGNTYLNVDTPGSGLQSVLYWKENGVGRASMFFNPVADVLNFKTYGADAIAFLTSGVERMRITYAGRVQVGSTSGNAYFDVSAPAGAQPVLYWKEGGVGRASMFYDPVGSELNFKTYGSDAITFVTSGYDRMSVRGNGNVGIGTTSPGSRLTVTGIIESTSGGLKFPDGTVQVTAATGGGNAWSINGNAGTTPGTHYIGTSDNTDLEIAVNGTCALRIEPHGTNPNLIGGYAGNSAAGTVGATISGGGSPSLTNVVFDDYGTIGGGTDNRAGSDDGNMAWGRYATVGGGSGNIATTNGAVVGGGYGNTASGGASTTVGGGSTNTASGAYAIVGGGSDNTASGNNAIVGGGSDNTASSSYATVPGGASNTASGVASFAAGARAKANHTGSFVWADYGSYNFTSTASNQFSVRATGGARFVSAIDGSGVPTAGVTLAAGGGSWASISDRSLKENITPVDGEEILDRLRLIPITEWNMKAQDPSIRHVGPMAQDFYNTFGLGEDERYINSSDADGIALLSIQALYELLLEKGDQIEELQASNEFLQAQMELLVTRLAVLEQKAEALR